jgi:hypothetical protein
LVFFLFPFVFFVGRQRGGGENTDEGGNVWSLSLLALGYKKMASPPQKTSLPFVVTISLLPIDITVPTITAFITHPDFRKSSRQHPEHARPLCIPPSTIAAMPGSKKKPSKIETNVAKGYLPAAGDRTAGGGTASYGNPSRQARHVGNPYANVQSAIGSPDAATPYWQENAEKKGGN